MVVLVTYVLIDLSTLCTAFADAGGGASAGKATGPKLHYGGIHTGDAWEHTRKHFCGDDYPNNMPTALVMFGDESHFESK